MFELWSQVCQLVSVFKDLYEMTYLFHLYGEIFIGMLSRGFLGWQRVASFLGPNADYFFGSSGCGVYRLFRFP